MLKKSLLALPLGVAGAALAAEPGSALGLGQLAGGFCTAIAGNLAHEAFNDADSQAAAIIFGRHPEIDGNHHVLIALRTAHLDALAVVLHGFNQDWANDRDERRHGEAERISEVISAFLKRSRKALKQVGTSGTTASGLERAVFERLSPAFLGGLAARGTTVNDITVTRVGIEDAVLDELALIDGCEDLPAAFERRFRGQGQAGWFELFLRSGAAALKSNAVFNAIWAAEQLAALRIDLGVVIKGFDRLDGKLDGMRSEISDQFADVRTSLEALTVEQRRIADREAMKRGIPVEQLAPILLRFGHQDVPVTDVPRVLAQAVDSLLARAGTLETIHNDGAAIDRAINDARAKLVNLDVAGALATIDDALATDESYAQALAAEAEATAHRVAMARGRARGHFEKAAIQRTVFDHNGAIASLEAGLALDPDATARWGDLGDVFRLTGSIARAKSAYRSAMAAAECSRDERDVGVSHNWIGDMLAAEGDRAGALAAYRSGLAIAERLAARDAGNTDWQRDLSISHNKIGDMLAAEGDRAEALLAYRAGLAIRKGLAARDAGNTEWQRDLSVSLSKIGNMLALAGDRAGALAAYREGLAIFERLAARDAGNAEWQRDLSVSHQKIGDMLAAEGERAEALAAYRQGLAIRQRLAARDAGNTLWQRDLSVSLSKIGDMLAAEGDRAGALAAYREGLAIRQGLAVRDPGNAEWQRDLSVSHNNIGDMLAAEGDRAGALVAYREDLAITERLVARDAGNAEWQRDLIVSYWTLATVEPERAVELYRAALAIAVRMRDAGKLAPVDEWMPGELERLIRDAGG